MSWSGQKEDARRAFRTLLVQEEVDPDRIIVIGHGEGGWRAMALAAERPREVVGVALLGSPGRGYRDLFAHQKGLLASMESGLGLPPNMEPYRRWYQEILEVSPENLIKALPCPLWIAQGGKDFEVDPQWAPSYLSRAAKKHRVEHKVARFPDLDHLFKYEPERSNHERYLELRAVDRKFISALVEWIKGRSK